MKSRKGFSSLSVQLTATVSVALVLLLLGMVATLAMAAGRITTDIKEHMGFDVVLKEQSTLGDINHFKQIFSEAPYVASFRYFSPEEANATWHEEMGENLTELLDVNPFLPEFEINVKEQYAEADSLDKIMLPLSELPQVDAVNGHAEVVDSVNRNLQTVMLILAIAVLTLLPISFVLINNTVRLTIFSRRFLIHTMKLVGASRGFIRKPFLLSNILQGLIAGVIASAILTGLYFYLWSLDASLQTLADPTMLICTCAGLLIVGPLLCLAAAAWATQRYLTISYDELF
ncbi:MAG: permease-like cell division protein FtsX [Bacteroides sp.]|nr:permease-like cell division protein FtsX [Bacteroides sp.]MCM1379337.1 permease-like cell division protein FtsX [Bacteroides sp.]MCM1445004.1 permease-like cell division protein FtsX [Prevotella sp.]